MRRALLVLMYFGAGPLVLIAIIAAILCSSCRHLPPASFDQPTHLPDGGELGWGP